MKKRLSKTVWYGSEVDTEGNPVVPRLAEGADDLEGLHHGELYLHEADDNLSIWARTLSNQVKPIGGLGGGGSLWKLMETESGEKFLFTEFNVVTQMGITSFADNKILDLPGIYDGLPIDNQTLYWEETDGVRILKAKGGSGEGTISDISLIGSGNAITDVSLNSDKTGLIFSKELEFALKTDLDTTKKKLDDFLEGSDTDTIINKWKELEAFLSGLAETDNLATILGTKADKEYVDENFVTLATSQTITGTKNFTGGLKVNGCELVYNSYYGYWKLTGDLLVTGGITAFSNSTSFNPSTIMDGVVTDGVTIHKNAYGQLEVIGGTGGGSVDEDSVKEIIESYNYLTTDKLPIATTSVKGIASFDSNSFSISNGLVSFSGGKVKVVTSEPSSYESNTLYVIVG